MYFFSWGFPVLFNFHLLCYMFHHLQLTVEFPYFTLFFATSYNSTFTFSNIIFISSAYSGHIIKVSLIYCLITSTSLVWYTFSQTWHTSIEHLLFGWHYSIFIFAYGEKNPSSLHYYRCRNILGSHQANSRNYI